MKARELALQVLKEVDEKKAYANLALEQALRGQEMPKPERALATELVYGSLRRLNTLDWILEQFMTRKLAKQTCWLRNILRLGLYQIYYLDKIPEFAAVNEAVQQAKKYANPGAAKFVNGVLRTIIRQKAEIVFPQPPSPEYLALVHSHPLWLVKRWLKQLGWAETESLCQANNQPAELTIRTNTLKISREALLAELEQEGWTVEPARYAPEGIYLKEISALSSSPAWQKGLFQVQSESSLLVSQALSPEPGSKILDLAAAPGGKTTHLAQMMQDQGEIWALDIYEHKLKLIQANFRRLGITCGQTFLQDATALPETWREQFDYVLADLPCSGLGVLNRRTEARWQKTEAQISELSKLQARILEQAAQALKPGGVLVYSTCTITPEENQQQWSRFLQAHPDWQEEDLGAFLSPELVKSPVGWVQLIPSQHQIDGFFIGRVRKGKN